ncbi:MAG: acetyl-CoA carboxylase biotin carboxyl carrier protein subunit [Bacteroidales bacterium]|nr:acetyl-CoA carboxylase biotin carboxyl carrier protein subunit [Bacteroidales bacterium]
MGNEKAKIKKLYAVSSGNRKYVFSNPLRDSIRIGNRKYDIRLKQDDKFGTYILWKNRKYPVEVVRSRQNRYEILFNDISYVFTIETPFGYRRMRVLSKQKGRKEKELVRSPMPGKIVDVLAREGSQVLKGEPVVILEAMKMQNEIQSPANGTVIKITAKPGATVNKDDVLVEIKVEA